MSQNPSELVTASIAIVSAVVGGILAGGATILAARRQRSHDDRADRNRRSYEAAGRCLASLIGLHEGLDYLKQAASNFTFAADRCNAFQSTVAIDGEAILDEPTREILWQHVNLVSVTMNITASGGRLHLGMIEAAKRHSDAARDALTCLRRDESCPPYNPPDLTDVQAILAWRAPVPANESG